MARTVRMRDSQTTLLLPRDLRQRLDRAKSSRSLGEEIRQRLERSFAAEAGDTKTRDLVRVIGDAVAEINAGYGLWHEVPFACDALRTAVADLIAFFRPEGEAIPKAIHGSPAAFYFVGQSAEEIGKGTTQIVLRNYLRSKREA